MISFSTALEAVIALVRDVLPSQQDMAVHLKAFLSFSWGGLQ